MMNEFLIKNASVVSDTSVTVLDVHIKEDRIVQLGSNLNENSATVIDATNKYLLPGLVDDQVHFREPGLTNKASIKTESLAAVAGGVTSYLEMPNTQPPTINQAELNKKLAIAKKDSYANYGFYLGTTGNNIKEISQAKEYGACGIKVFLGASTGNLLVDEQEKLNNIFQAVPDNMVLSAHCEDVTLLKQREAYFKDEYGYVMPMEFHSIIRNDEVCKAATKRAMDLAHQHNTKLHVLHLTTATEMDLFTAGEIDDKLITAEVCVHHLFFNDSNYKESQGLIKCNPSIKTKEDQLALFQAIKDKKIDVIATDHAPHTYLDKTTPTWYQDIPAGLPLIQYSLNILLDLVKQGHLSLSDIARLAAKNPAKLFNIKERGEIKEGYYADLVLVDLNRPCPASDSAVLYQSKWTPFNNYEFSASIEEVWVSGQHVVQDGSIALETRVHNYLTPTSNKA